MSGHLFKKKLTNKLTNKQIKTILPGAYKLYQTVYIDFQNTTEFTLKVNDIQIKIVSRYMYIANCFWRRPYFIASFYVLHKFKENFS